MIPSLEAKRLAAIDWLRSRAYETGASHYLLDPGSPRPSWAARGSSEPPRFPRVFFTEFPAICREWEV